MLGAILFEQKKTTNFEGDPQLVPPPNSGEVVFVFSGDAKKVAFAEAAEMRRY